MDESCNTHYSTNVNRLDQGGLRSRPRIKELREKISQGEAPSFNFASDGILRNDSKVVLPKDDKLRKEILDEAHKTQYTVHPRSTKMY
jgi:hypothetical protein